MGSWKRLLEEILSKAFLDLIAEDVVKSPAQFFGDTFWNSLLKIGSSAVMPFALVILAYLWSAELYSSYCRTNGSLDVEMVFQTSVKFIFPFLLINGTYDLLNIVFALTNNMVGEIASSSAIVMADATGAIDLFDLKDEGFFAMILAYMEFMPAFLGMMLMKMVVTVIVYGRMLEIVICWIFSPIPMATMIHSEHSQIAKNFIKLFAALLIQGGLILLCCTIYSFLISREVMSTDMSMWSVLALVIFLGFALFKTGSMAKRMLGTF